MKSKLFMFAKGLLLGLAIVLPGISFSMLAIILNCYKDILSSLSNFYKSPIKQIKKMFPLVLGILFSCIIVVFPLSICLKMQPFLTVFFFSGVLIRCLINLLKKINIITYKDFIFYILGFLLSFAIFIFPNYEGFTFVFKLETNYLLYLLIVSFISSFCALSPSLSLTFVLLTIGFYDVFINTLFSIIDSIKLLDFSFIYKYGLTSLILLILVSIFLIILSKTLYKIINKYEKQSYLFFIGSTTSSIFLTIFNTNIETSNVSIDYLCYTLICSYTFLYLGYKVIVYLENLVNKRISKNEIR